MLTKVLAWLASFFSCQLGDACQDSENSSSVGEEDLAQCAGSGSAFWILRCLWMARFWQFLVWADPDLPMMCQ